MGTAVGKLETQHPGVMSVLLWSGNLLQGFPGGSDGKESVCNAGDMGSIPGEGNGNPLQHSWLENSMY